jgi:hypothetical protein
MHWQDALAARRLQGLICGLPQNEAFHAITDSNIINCEADNLTKSHAGEDRD